jgi:glutathione synthase/RimK-type ligase-like ATP-grasp enzyme
MKKPLLAILKNESDQDYVLWVASCEKMSNRLDFDVIDLTLNDWIEKVMAKDYDMFLAIPPGVTSLFKQLYDERIWIINNTLSKPIYPTLTEIFIYENKRNLSYWLKVNKIDAPKTYVYYYKNEALDFIKTAKYPVVSKLNIGASGNGVKFLQDKSEAENYVEQAFSINGLEFKSGPKLKKGNMLKKVKKVLFKKGYFSNRMKEYKALSSENQRGFVMFQDFVPHSFEWRCVRIGDSYFAHKKVAKKGKASGTLDKSYDNPPLELLDFIDQFSNKFGITSAAIDLFEHNGKYLINEIQCIFGQSDEYQMLVDGKPGRYVRKNDKWFFEEGLFNTNKNYDLRLEHALSLLKE